MRAYGAPSVWSRLVLATTVVTVGLFAMTGLGEASPGDRHGAALRHAIAHLHTMPFHGMANGSLSHAGVAATWSVGPVEDGMRTVIIVTRVDGARSEPNSLSSRTTVHRFAARRASASGRERTEVR